MRAQIKTLARRFVEEWNKEKAATMVALDKLFATDFVIHSGTGELLHALWDYLNEHNKFLVLTLDENCTFIASQPSTRLTFSISNYLEKRQQK